jgi:hypothetical protein
MSGITECTVADIFNYIEKVNEKRARAHILVLWTQILYHGGEIFLLHCCNVVEDLSP